jgi:hypothetical protein
MADYRWTGASSGVWKLAANWAAYPGNGAVANYPGETALQYDKVYFDTAKGSGNDCAGVTALTESLAHIYVGGEWDGIIGTGPSPVEVRCTNVDIEATTQSDIYLKGPAGGALGIINVRSGKLYLDGNVSEAHLMKGNVTLQPGCTFNTGTLWVGYVSTPATDMNLTIEAGVTFPTNVHINGGVITNRADIGTLRIAAGEIRQYANITGTLVTYGGVVKWYNGDINIADLFGGKLDGSVSALPRTLTNSRLGPGATLDLNNAARAITVTNPILDLGGSLVPPPGAYVSIA